MNGCLCKLFLQPVNSVSSRRDQYFVMLSLSSMDNVRTSSLGGNVNRCLLPSVPSDIIGAGEDDFNNSANFFFNQNLVVDPINDLVEDQVISGICNWNCN